MTAGSQYLHLDIFDDAWDPDISCTQKIKPNFKMVFLPHRFSFTNPTFHTSHEVLLPFFQLLLKTLSTKSLERWKEQILSREKRSQAFHCHSHVSAVNLVCARNKNCLRLPQDQEQFQSSLESARYVFSVCFPQKGHGVIEAIKSKVKLVRSMPLLMLLFPIASEGKSRIHKADITGLNT